MDENRNRPPLTVLWEEISDPDYEEHLRRIFVILLEGPQNTFDENAIKSQDESVAHSQTDLSG
jgi:hypothetical protein